MTINISLCTVVLISGATLGRPCFNVIQLLWVNLIMDTLGAIAICTEPPAHDHHVLQEGEEVKTNRISRKDKIILPLMWRNIIGQVAY
jgi:magnesium-transporting ATPase (P-type)